MAQSHQDAADKSDDQDYLMSNEDDEQLEVHSQAAPQSSTTPLVTCD